MDKINQTQIESWMKLFQEVSEYHWRLNMEPAWERYEEGRKPWQSVALFLSTYAFEKTGASPNYAPVAADVIKRHKEEFDAGIETDTTLERKIWGRVQKIMESRKEKLNPNRHPLAPGQKKLSLIRLMQEKKMANLVKVMKTYLKPQNSRKIKIKEASDFLKSICGVGKKVAPFFLCSVKEYFGIALPKDEKRNHLQPVDIWIKRIFGRLNNHPQPYDPDHKSNPKIPDNEIASFIVRHSENPERVNMGMWYFGAVVCGRGWYRFEQVLKDLETAKSAWKQHRERLTRICPINSGEHA